MIKRTLIVVVAFFAGAVVQVSAQNLVTNGDFSSNAVNFKAYPGYVGQTDTSGNINPTIANWTGTGLVGINGNDTGTNVKNIFGPTSLTNLTGGQDFAFLQNGTGGVAAASLSQVLTLTAGRQYTISFEAASRKDDVNGTTTTTYTVPTGSATLTSGLGAVQTINISGLSKQNFTLFTGTFTAATNTDTLSFNNLNPADGSSLDISDISLTIVPVPEPATWLAGVLLLGGATWTLRRRTLVRLV